MSEDQEKPIADRNETGPKKIEITVSGAEAEGPSDEKTHDKPTNAYAAKASSAYQQQTAKAAEVADSKTAENTVEAGPSDTDDVWDEMDHNPPDGEATPTADISALEQEVAALKDQLARALAEQENVRKRMTKEADDARKYAASKFASDMLSVSDNLRRAIQSVDPEARETAAVKLVLEGVELTERELRAAFERHKIVCLNPEGEKFNPNQHEAMFEIPSGDVAPGTVMQVIQPGYMIADRLLRPARVGVSKVAYA